MIREWQTLQHDGLERRYLLFRPNRAGGQSLPLVLAFHGGGSNAEELVTQSGLVEAAEREGFVVVFPQGSGRSEANFTWNAGVCCGYAARYEVDDVGFARELIESLVQSGLVERRQVFATGFSNGAMLCYRLAGELADRLVAIAAVGGPISHMNYLPSRPVPVLHFHGTADEYAPYLGGPGSIPLAKVNFASVPETIETWRQINGCPRDPLLTEIPDRARDGTTATRYVYGPGRDGSEVVLYQIHSGGHTWPGQPSPWPKLGPVTMNVDANRVMWEFFMRHATGRA